MKLFLETLWPYIMGLMTGAGFGVAAYQHWGVSDSASLDQCAQSEQVCNAVAERMGIVVTIPPWQAMVLTPILDPR